MTSIYPIGDDVPAWLEVDLDAIRRNAERFYRAAGVPLVAMVKADAYGLGAISIARALLPMGDAIWGFGVASVVEAERLRDAGITRRLLCVSPLLPSQFSRAHALGLTPSLQRAADIHAWGMLGGAWHLGVDSGMARAGVRWDDVDALIPIVRAHPPEGVYTHFHSAELSDDSRMLQETRFECALERLKDALPAGILIHRDNSAAVAARWFAGPEARTATEANRKALVRPGIGLYGGVACVGIPLEQTVALRARVIDTRTVFDGESVSYDAAWRAQGTRRIATIAIGYGDGYRRAFSNRGRVLLHGKSVAVAGIVTMDMTMLDVTDVACDVGDIATFLGTDGDATLSVEEVATGAALSPYELLVGLQLRVPRVYLGLTADA